MGNFHITMISSMPPIIGLSPYTKELVVALSQKIKVTVLGFNHIYPTFLYPGKEKDDSLICPPETANLIIKNILNWYNPIQWIIEAFRIDTDIIHAQWWSFPLAPIYFTILWINRLRGKKIILTIHNVEPHEKSLMKKFFNKSIFWLADEYIVHTKKNKEQLGKYINDKPIYIIPHGIIKPPLKGISKQDARRILNINDGDKILLCFGHIRDYKGLDTALEALSQISDPSIKLMIAGKCWEDWNKYNQLIEKYNLKDRVILKLDFISNDDIEPIFMASDIVLLPYKHFDAQSGVGATVLPFGIPMIVSNVGGLTDYVNDEASIIEPNNHNALSIKIIEIFNNTKLYKKLISDVEKTKENLNWSTIAKTTEQIYK